MLKKLVGALVFSQKALASQPIDRTNYHYHLCDNDLVVPVGRPTGEATMSTAERFEAAAIRNHYENYCHAKLDYEKALEDGKVRRTAFATTFCGESGGQGISYRQCTEKKGILYAKACEQLKDDRDTLRKQWNFAVIDIPSCNNMRRR